MNAPAQGTSLLTMIAPRVLAQADRLRDRFLGARPFAHCAIDGFFADNRDVRHVQLCRCQRVILRDIDLLMQSCRAGCCVYRPD